MNRLLSFILLGVVLFGAGCTKPPPSKMSAVPVKVSSIHEQVGISRIIGAEAIIKEYFSDINSKKYAEAYQFFTEDMKRVYPYNDWINGYKNTLDQLVDAISCAGDSCVASVIATEQRTKDIRKQKYVFTYSFVQGPNSEIFISSSKLLSTETVQVLKTFNTDDAAAFILNFQEAADLIASEGSTFSKDAVDPTLQARYAEGSNDVPLMRYLGRKGLNNIEANNLGDRLTQLKASPAYTHFSGSVDKLDKALVFVKRFYSNLATVESFTDFKQYTADIASYYESIRSISGTLEIEYAAFKDAHPGSDFRMTDGVAALVISSYSNSEPAPPLQPPKIPIPQMLTQPTVETQAQDSRPSSCCKICTTGKACGNSCISRSYTCHKGPGCACDAY